MNQYSKNCTWSNEIFDSNAVTETVVGVIVFATDEIDGIGGAGNKEDFHNGVVQGECGSKWIGEEEIEVASSKDDEVELLSFERYSSTGMGSLNFEKKEENRGNVREVTKPPKDIKHHCGTSWSARSCLEIGFTCGIVWLCRMYLFCAR